MFITCVTFIFIILMYNKNVLADYPRSRLVKYPLLFKSIQKLVSIDFPYYFLCVIMCPLSQNFLIILQNLLVSLIYVFVFYFQTPADHEDVTLIDRACAQVEEIIKAVDTHTGKSKCTFTQEKLDYIDEKQVRNSPICSIYLY